MRKSYFQWKAFLLSLVFIPGLVVAQDYNNIHRFATDYERSAHTCATQLRNGKIVEGGTINSLNINSNKVVELGIVDPFSGTLTPHPLTYAYSGLNHRAADLVESLGDPGYVVCAANLDSPFESRSIINVFKADPSSGSVLWSLVYKSGNGSQVANAICHDREKSYFIIGQARFGGTNFMYVIKLKDDATPLWERYYFTGNRNDLLDGVDVIFDGNAVVVTGNLTTSTVDPNDRGIIIAKLNPANGSVLDVRHLSHLNGNPNIKVRDLQLINGNYVMVGEYNRNPIGVFGPRRGFMVSYNSLLNINATRIYGDGSNRDVIATGVEPGIFGGMYISFDLGTNTRSNYIPGIIHANALGTLISSEIYKIEGYLGTNGLIGVHNLRSYMIKGSTSSLSSTGAPSLSLIGQSVPLANNDAICGRLYELKNESVGYRNLAIKLDAERDETVDKIELEVDRVDGRTVNCNGTVIGSFKLAAPAKIDELTNDNSLAETFEVYPNPSNGQIAIRFTDGETAAFQIGEVYNLMGEVVSTFNINSTINYVDLSGNASGVYLLRLKSSDGNTSDTKRITIK